MIFFFGLGSGKRNLKLSVGTTCGICKNSGSKGLYKTYEYFHIFFIPIIFFLVKYYLVCPTCNNGLEISKKDYLSIKNGVIPAHLQAEDLIEQIKAKIKQDTEKEEVFQTISEILEIASTHPVLSKNTDKLNDAILSHLKKKYENNTNIDAYVSEYFSKKSLS